MDRVIPLLMYDQLPLVCFIVCDSGPGTHFAEFARSLLADGDLRIDVYANGLTLSKFQGLQTMDGIRLFRFIADELNPEEEQKLAIELLDSCVANGAQTIIVDIANKFDRKLQEAFHQLDTASHHIRFWCYYDNPEDYVPGGYSIRSGEMIKQSRNILFANRNLVKREAKIFSLPNIAINLSDKNIQGIGYYPIKTAEILQKRREVERETLRRKYGWNEREYIFIYFGGNNSAYYQQAFPGFLSFLSEIGGKSQENILFLIQQHPAAKRQNQDGLLFQQWLLKNDHVQAVLSELTSDEAQVIADAAVYYQTSMAPQFTFLGLPTMQVGHEIYPDMLVKHNLCETATNSMELIKGLEILKEKCHRSNRTVHKQLIYDAIGYTSDWPKNLRNVILDLE